MAKKYLCIIPARKGSKGIKNKNIILLKQKPLIQYTIDIARKLGKNFEVVVSTDSRKIYKIIKKNKLNFFGFRPKKLSGDYALTKDVVKFELKKVEDTLKFKFFGIILLQPTCPIRKITTIVRAIKLLNKKKYDSIISLSEVGAYHPYRMKIFQNGYLKNFMKFKNENMLPRQKLPKLYIRSGSFYLIKRDIFLKYNSLVGKKCKGIILKGLETINIDKIEDLEYLKLKLK
jgi:CMP-N,N'-diacetyllegionaminic acid synthase